LLKSGVSLRLIRGGAAWARVAGTTVDPPAERRGCAASTGSRRIVIDAAFSRVDYKTNTAEFKAFEEYGT